MTSSTEWRSWRGKLLLSLIFAGRVHPLSITVNTGNTVNTVAAGEDCGCRRRLWLQEKTVAAGDWTHRTFLIFLIDVWSLYLILLTELLSLWSGLNQQKLGIVCGTYAHSGSLTWPGLYPEIFWYLLSALTTELAGCMGPAVNNIFVSCRDKANLSATVGTYSQKLYQDFEDLDRISIQADMWKSKFQASR